MERFAGGSVRTWNGLRISPLSFEGPFEGPLAQSQMRGGDGNTSDDITSGDFTAVTPSAGRHRAPVEVDRRLGLELPSVPACAIIDACGAINVRFRIVHLDVEHWAEHRVAHWAWRIRSVNMPYTQGLF